MEKTKDVLIVPPLDELGNTRVVHPSKRWCFTLHDYTIDDIKNLNSNDVLKMMTFICFSEELGGSGETRHLQGYFELKKRKRWNELGFRKEFHFEKAKGNKEVNISYIEKEGGNMYINGKLKRNPVIIKQLRDWQRKIVDVLGEEPDDRLINWYYDLKGNTGKTKLAIYIMDKFKACYLSGKTNDMFYGVVKYKELVGVYPDIVVIDIPRSVDSEYINYTAIEKLKDGIFFSGKYECCSVLMANPHVIVFSNEEPDYSKMSGDRWNVVCIDNMT